MSRQPIASEHGVEHYRYVEPPGRAAPESRRLGAKGRSTEKMCRAAWTLVDERPGPFA